VRPRKDKRGVDLVCDALPFGRLWYGERDAITNAHDAVIRVYDEAGNMIETHERKREFKSCKKLPRPTLCD
jgi:hypothetical protein